MTEADSSDVPELRRLYAKAEFHNMLLAKVIEDDLNDLAREYERLHSGVAGPMLGLIVCAALAIGLYLFAEPPAAMLFGVLAGIGGYGVIRNIDARTSIERRIASMEDRLHDHGHKAEWTKKKKRGDVPKVTVVRKKN